MGRNCHRRYGQNAEVFYGAILMQAYPDSVTLMGGVYSLACVSIGNIIGGAGFIGVGYFLTANPLFPASGGQKENNFYLI
jgi:hypothetical protein